MANEQTALWNGVAGRAWVDLEEVLDCTYQPVQELLVQAIPAGCAWHVLDVGCGTGAVTRAIARRLGPGGAAVGIDLSVPLVDAARARAEREGSSATFVCANAQSHRFDAVSFRLIVSRFGIMFFDDAVEAFKSLRGAASEGAELRFVAWRSAEQNPFMTAAERAAAPLLPDAPPRAPGAPGQFAFEDSQRVQQILKQSGWVGVDIRAVDLPCVFPEAELERYITRLGPLGRVLHQADERTRAALIERVRPAFDVYVHAGEVRFTAACWLVSARAPQPAAA
jgi:SAM-dependent methyltransferase